MSNVFLLFLCVLIIAIWNYEERRKPQDESANINRFSMTRSICTMQCSTNWCILIARIAPSLTFWKYTEQEGNPRILENPKYPIFRIKSDEWNAQFGNLRVLRTRDKLSHSFERRKCNRRRQIIIKSKTQNSEPSKALQMHIRVIYDPRYFFPNIAQPCFHSFYEMVVHAIYVLRHTISFPRIDKIVVIACCQPYVDSAPLFYGCLLPINADRKRGLTRELFAERAKYPASLNFYDSTIRHYLHTRS
jgi:hypothetical protein